MEEQNQRFVRRTLWQKLSVPLLTIGVGLMVVFFQWLFSSAYPSDSYRVFTNWEITELTADNLLTEKRIDGIYKTMDRKGLKTVWIDDINSVVFNSAGKLTSADITFLACEADGQARRYQLTLFPEVNDIPVIFARLEGVLQVGEEEREDRVPFSLLYTLSNHPMSDLANQRPIANESSFVLSAAKEDPTQPLRLHENRSPLTPLELDKENVWFVRQDGGWFTVTQPDQVSKTYITLNVSVRNPAAASEEGYGTILLESSSQ